MTYTFCNYKLANGVNKVLSWLLMASFQDITYFAILQKISNFKFIISTWELAIEL